MTQIPRLCLISQSKLCDLKLIANGEKSLPAYKVAEWVGGQPRADSAACAPSTGPQVANQATLATRRVLRQYYDGELRSDNQMDSTVSRDLCLRCPLTAATSAPFCVLA